MSTLVLICGISLPSATVAPYALSVVELRWLGQVIPAPPDSSLLETSTGPLGSSMAGPSVTKTFDTATKITSVVLFYRKQLEANGWKKVRTWKDGVWFARAGRHMFVKVSGQPHRTIVEVTYNKDYVTAPLLVLLAAVISCLYVWRVYRRRTRRDSGSAPKNT